MLTVFYYRTTREYDENRFKYNFKPTENRRKLNENYGVHSTRYDYDITVPGVRGCDEIHALFLDGYQKNALRAHNIVGTIYKFDVDASENILV